MSFVVSARKYRPQNFDDLIGQNHIATTLKNAIKNDKLAHAFLFSGPRGVGKTTSARILAKVLNCENLSPEFHACGTCDSCKASENNASFNIFELDAASNNSVDHVRALNDQVRFQPQQGAYKIYIIDEVHMLSQAAFNAFLKTLEEPPPYAKFILATTEKHKIIPTILSRCQIFDFRRIQVTDIVTQLSLIATKESRKIEDGALHLIAQKADGAMRDALSIYDKVVSSVEGDIDYSDVAENLNVLDHDYYFKITDASIKEDFSSLMLIADDIFKKGFEAEQFIIGMMDHLRQLLFIKDVRTADTLECGEQLKKRYADQAHLTTSSFLMTSLSLLDKVSSDIPRSLNKRMSIEVALSKIAYMNRVMDKKKTSDLSLDAEIKKVEPAQPSKSPDTNEIEKRQAESKSEFQTSALQADQPPVKTSSPSEPKKAKGVAKMTPAISSNIDQLIQDVEAEESSKLQNKNPFTADHIKGILDKWKEKSDSNSFKAAVEHSHISIEEELIHITTPTELYIDLLRLELNMIAEIHAQYPEKDVTIKFTADISMFPHYEAPQTPKYLTTMEKYELLKKRNPNFESLLIPLN